MNNVAFHLNKHPRQYQLTALRYATEMKKSTVCLPTGTGKTLVGILFCEWLFNTQNIKRVLILEPTRFLVNQITADYREDGGADAHYITGSFRKEDRKERWKSPIIVATPQTVFNDREWLNENNLLFDALVIDECHHTVGLHAYAELVKYLNDTTKPDYMLGLSATVPNRLRFQIEKLIGPIREWKWNDADISQYVPDCIAEVYEAEFDHTNGKYDPQSSDREKSLLNNLVEIKRQLSGDRAAQFPSRAMIWFSRDSASTLKESLGKNNMTSAMLSPLIGNDVNQVCHWRGEHKMDALLRILQSHDFQKAIVFVDRVSLADTITNYPQLKHLNPRQIIGIKHASEEKRENILNEIRNSFDVKLIVATAAGEEGIDIPTMDLLICWSNRSSDIKFIQRLGRIMRKSIAPVKYATFITTPDTYDHDMFCRGLFKFKQYLEDEEKISLDIMNLDIPWESSTAARLIKQLKDGEIPYSDTYFGGRHYHEWGSNDSERDNSFKYLLWSGFGSYFVDLDKVTSNHEGKSVINLLMIPSKHSRIYYHIDQAEEIVRKYPKHFQYATDVKLSVSIRDIINRRNELNHYFGLLEEVFPKLENRLENRGFIYELRLHRGGGGRFVNLSYYYIHDKTILRKCLENAYSVATNII